MGFEEKYRALRRRIDTEQALLVIMIIISAYMFWGSYNFSHSSAARFPRITAGSVLVGSLLLLFSDYLPKRVQSFVSEDMEVFDTEEKIEKDDQVIEKDDQVAEETRDDSSMSTVDRPVDDSLFTAVSAVGYGITGYIIGILWATPIFVVAYTVWFRRPWYQIIGLAGIGFLIAYGFMEVLNVPMNQGEILFQEGFGWF